MRVDWVIPCRFVEVNNGLATIVGAGVDIFTVSAFPVPVQLPIAIRLIGLPDENDHTLNVTILGPSMVPVAEPLSATFKATTNPLLLEGWESATLIPLLVAFEATEEGPNTVNVEVDGTSKSIPIRVVLGTTPRD